MVICLEQGADCFAYGPADATACPNPIITRTTWVSQFQKGKTSLDLNEASFKSRLVLPFWNWLTQVVLVLYEVVLVLYECSSSSSSSSSSSNTSFATLLHFFVYWVVLKIT